MAEVEDDCAVLEHDDIAMLNAMVQENMTLGKLTPIQTLNAWRRRLG